MHVKHVIVPAAGFGTRFLPYTKAVCKELVPLIDKPIIHHIAQEAIASGCTSISMVINKNKQALQDYFTHNQTLHEFLKIHAKEHLIADVEQLIKQGSFTFFMQEQQHGVADAIMQALPALDNDFFGIMYPDDLIFGEQPALLQLIDVAREKQASVLAVTQVPRERISAYGVIEPGEWVSDSLCKVNRIVEKPSPNQAPSCWAVIGRFVVSPALIPALHHCKKQLGEAFLFTDVIEHLAKTEPVYAYRVNGVRHDTGTPEGWLTSIIDYASRSSRYAPMVVGMTTLGNEPVETQL
jgi:UTP--glucose-1-phosphate uridylyltransferase